LFGGIGENGKSRRKGIEFKNASDEETIKGKVPKAKVSQS
jgi:hypothetical protein